jgi:hypothetical protein
VACETTLTLSKKDAEYRYNAGLLSTEEFEKYLCAWWRTAPRFTEALVPACAHCGAEGYWNG